MSLFLKIFLSARLSAYNEVFKCYLQHLLIYYGDANRKKGTIPRYTWLQTRCYRQSLLLVYNTTEKCIPPRTHIHIYNISSDLLTTRQSSFR